MGNGKWGVKVEVMRASKLQDQYDMIPHISVIQGICTPDGKIR